MQKKRNSVLGIGKRTRKWGLALLVAVTVIASAGLSGSVGAKQNPGPAAAIGGPGDTHAAVDAFHTMMKVELVDGTMLGSAFEIKDFSFGVENPTTIGSATGGAGAGRIEFNEFTIKKTTDAASPAFFKNCAAGAHYAKVTLEMRKVDKKGNESPFMKWTFETVFTTKIDWSGPGDEGPEESITFVYGKLGISYFRQDGPGAFTEIHEGWDQVQNRESD